MKRFFFLLFCGLLWNVTFATTSALDCRRQTPAVFENSWIYLSAGVSDTFFQDSIFAAGYQFGEQEDTIGAMRLSIGHYFNPFIALSLSLMRGIYSNKFSDVQTSVFPITEEMANAEYSVTNNLFTLALRPTLPLKYGLSIYGEGGVGYISRKGFSINDDVVVSNGTFVTGVVGAGINYEMSSGVVIGVDSEYALSLQSQPGIFYVGVGLGYINRPGNQLRITPSDNIYYFPLNLIQLNYMNQSIVYAEVAEYFTPPYLPIFFNGRIKVGEGLELLYERNFFHTDKNFSLEWGVSAAQWQSHELKQNFFTLSIFPELKIWMVRSPKFDFYFEYSLAGPSYISRVYIDNLDSGSHFTFQDFLGIGAFLGAAKRLNINLRIVHFSNGNTFPINTGLAVPVMLGVGFAW